MLSEQQEALMRKLMLKMDLSMDGLCAEADPDGKQDWQFSTADDESNAWELAFVKNAGFHAMGHKTYRGMASYWPVSTNLFAAPMNSIPKVVFTRSGLDADDAKIAPRAVEAARAHLKDKQIPNDDIVRSWTHPRVAKGDMADEVAKLKRDGDQDIIAYVDLRGFCERAQWLVAIVGMKLRRRYRAAIGTEDRSQLVRHDRSRALIHLDRERRTELGIWILHAE